MVSFLFYTMSLYFGDVKSCFSFWFIDFCYSRSCFRCLSCSSFCLFLSIISLIFFVISSFFWVTLSGDKDWEPKPIEFSYCLSSTAREPPDMGVVGRSDLTTVISGLYALYAVENEAYNFFLEALYCYASYCLAFVKKNPELSRSRFVILESAVVYNSFRSSSSSIIRTSAFFKSPSCIFYSCSTTIVRCLWNFYW